MKTMEGSQAKRIKSTKTQRTEHSPNLQVTKEAQSSKDILECLHPETITDEDGIARTIYTFANHKGVPVRVMFYAPEETPYTKDALEGHQIVVLGDKPNWRSKEDWDQYIEKVRATSSGIGNVLNPSVVDKSVYEGNTTYLVENRLDKILDMAFSLGLNDGQLRNLRRELVHHKFNDETEEMLDQIIAGKMLNDKGELKKYTDTEGEALFLLALQGDKASQDLLSQKLSQLKTLQAKSKEASIEEMKQRLESGGKGELEPFSMDELVAVHMTKYSPKYNADEESWDMQTLFDATNWTYPRTSMHTSLNHAVEPAGVYGSWENTPIAVISPMNKMIEKNGKPAVLNTVDTIFEVSPGRRLHIPKEGSAIIKPGQLKNSTQLYEKMANGEIIYAADVNPKQTKRIIELMNDRAKSWLNVDVREAVLSTFSVYDENETRDKLTIPEQDFERLITTLGVFTGSAAPGSYGGKVYFGEDYDHIDISEALKEKGVSEWVRGILTDAGIIDKLDPTTIGTVISKVKSQFVKMIKKRAISETIETMGYKIQPGGMWAWADSFDITNKTAATAVQLGIRSGAHTHDITGAVEEVTARKLGALSKKDISPAEYKKRVSTVSLGEKSMAQLRMEYLVGAM